MSIGRDSRRVSLVVAIAAALSSAAASRAGAQAAGAASLLPATLAPVVDELRTTLALTDAQSAQVARLLVDGVGRASAVMDRAHDLSLETVVDLLATSRSIKDEFLPRLSSVLTDEQKAKLQALPASSGVYVAAMAGWLAEARLNKLQGALKLTDAQVPGIRQALLDQFRTMARTVTGFTSKDVGASAVLDVLVDLRAAQRLGRRSVQGLLTPEQVRALEAWEAAKASGPN